MILSIHALPGFKNRGTMTVKQRWLLLVPALLLAILLFIVWPRPRVAARSMFDPNAQFPTLAPAWSLLGPFDWQPDANASAATGADIIAAEAKIVSGIGTLPRLDRVPWQTVSNDAGLPLIPFDSTKAAYQVLFAVTEFSSSSELDCALIVLGAPWEGGSKAWINGAVVDISTPVGGITSYLVGGSSTVAGLSPVRIHKGANRVVLKLVRARAARGSAWAFSAGLRTLAVAREERAIRAGNAFQELLTPVVAGHITLDLRLFEAGKNITVTLFNSRRQVEKQLKLPGGVCQKVDVRDLPLGLHYSQVHESPFPELSPFYRGDVTKAYQDFKRQVAPLLPNPAHNLNLGVLIARFEHLQKNQPPENDPEHRYWQAKIVNVIAEWSSILQALANHKNPYRDIPGMHLRGFRSHIDGQPQYYLLRVPDQYSRNNGAIPLVIIMPFVLDYSVPFIYSHPVAAAKVNVPFGRIAEANGFAYLWMDSRARGSDFGETDMFTAIEQVMRDYSIDPERLYLVGICSGARDALTLAAKYPDRFAAVGIQDPAPTFKAFSPIRPTDAYADLWLRYKTPLNTIASLVNVPVFDIHGDLNYHSPFRESLSLRDAALKAGVSFYLEAVSGARQDQFPIDPRALIFAWLQKQRRVANPNHVVLIAPEMRFNKAYWIEINRFIDAALPGRVEAWYQNGEIRVHTENVGEYSLDCHLLRQKGQHLLIKTDGAISFQGAVGDKDRIRIPVVPSLSLGNRPPKTPQVGGPLFDVFTGPFLVVQGTGGDPADRRAANILAGKFIASWREHYFVDCPVKRDSDLTIEDIRKYSLVLFGSPQTNRFLGKIINDLPFRLHGNFIEGPGRNYNASLFSLQYVYPNPLSPNRYILIAGYPPCPECPTDSIQLTLKAWYDYVIWRRTGSGEASVEDVGKFDNTWGKLISRTVPSIE